MAHVHHVTETDRHCRWDKTIPPVLTVEPGDTIVFDTPDTINGQIRADSTSADLAALDFEPIHQINGPVFVEGAQPGDTLIVEIIEITPKEWGWTGMIPWIRITPG